jgi:ribosome-binding protein aMBF1 (putative translation factor)
MLLGATLARMLGNSQTALGQLESGKSTISVEKRNDIERIEKILEKAAQAMRREYIATWIEKTRPWGHS